MAIWNAVGLVTGGFSLVAFIAAGVYWTYRRSLLSIERLVVSVPEIDRPGILQDFFQSVHVETGNLTKEQQYRLARQIITARTKATAQKAILVGFLGLIAGAVAVFALVGKPGGGTDHSSTTDPASVQRKLLLKGKIQEELTGDPIEGAVVSASAGTIQEATTDSYGRFDFQFTSTESNPLVQLRVTAEGYKPASESLRLQEPTSTWEVALRSIAQSDLRKLIGSWEANADDDGARVKFVLSLSQAGPVDLRGTIAVILESPPEGTVPDLIQQPTGPLLECRAEGVALLSGENNSLKMHFEDFQTAVQKLGEADCGLEVPDVDLEVQGVSSTEMRLKPPPPRPLLVFRKVGT